MIQRVVILGGGSAGFLSALALKAKLPQLDVVLLRSPEIRIIGVGEATTVSVPDYLHCNFKIDPGDLHRRVQATWKVGIKFLWGPRPYFNYTFAQQFTTQYQSLRKPSGFYVNGNVEFANQASALMTLDKAFPRGRDGAPALTHNYAAYHLENGAFVLYLEETARERGVRVIEDTVGEVEQDEKGIRALLCKSGRPVQSDFWIDCSGFSSFLLGKTLKVPFVSFKRSLPCDRAVWGGWERSPEEVIQPYTTAETMESGWCWRIDHDRLIHRGYVYCSDFISDEEAEGEFRRKNPKVGSTHPIRFVSGYYERGWKKNVVAIGNAAGFVEPLESTSLAVICDEAWAVAKTLAETDLEPGQATVNSYNKWLRQTWESIRSFLSLHYKFNTRLDTPFWRTCRQEVELGDCAKEYVSYFEEDGPSLLWINTIIQGRDAFGPEGWVTILIGQDVPYRRKYVPGEAEKRAWKKIQARNWAACANGIGVAEMSQFARSPNWQFPKDFFRPR